MLADARLSKVLRRISVRGERSIAQLVVFALEWIYKRNIASTLPRQLSNHLTVLCAQWFSCYQISADEVHILKQSLPSIFDTLALCSAGGMDIKVSTSQCGEDLIIRHIFTNRGVSAPSYLDIGAHHPLRFSNTALFYSSGSRGINVEPNPDLIQEFHRLRPNDRNLQLAIGDHSAVGTLHIPVTSDALASIDSSNIQDMLGARIILVSVVTLADLIANYADGLVPDFLSVDVEGLDLKVLRQLEALPMLPSVVCVETISYSTTGQGVKDQDICLLMSRLGYIAYADTNINSIFVLRSFWQLGDPS